MTLIERASQSLYFLPSEALEYQLQGAEELSLLPPTEIVDISLMIGGMNA
ncbi:MAG: hypothetical protein MK434_11600 [SAR324 cluster bacterium]|nr:hypothetical protein [SAR324 cluster bacterium]